MFLNNMTGGEKMDREYQKVLDSCAEVAGKVQSGWYAEQSSAARQGKIFSRRKEGLLSDLKSIDREVLSMMKKDSGNMLCRVIRECGIKKKLCR